MTYLTYTTDVLSSWEEKSVFPLVRISAPYALGLVSQKSAQDLVDRIFNNINKKPPRVFAHRKDIELANFPPSYIGSLPNPELRLPKDYFRPILIIHQCVAIITKSEEMNEQFLRIYIDILDQFLGIKRDALVMTLKHHGIDGVEIDE